MTVLTKTGASKAARIGVALGIAAAAVVGSATASSAAAATLTISPATGSTAGATLALVAPAGTFKTAGGSLLIKNTTGTITAGAIQLSTAACGTTPGTTGTPVASTTTYTYNVTVGNITVVSGAKVVLKTGAVAAKAYNVCVYGASANIATGKYTSFSPATATAVTPSSGPVYGGGTVTVDGTNFTAKTTATIGGVALTAIKVATDGNSFTATVPANSGGAKTLSVTTEGGTVNLSSAYTYKDGLAITPNTMTGSGTAVLDVTGYGFNTDTTLDWSKADGSDPTSLSHLFLVAGDYNPTTNSGAKTNPEVAECLNPVIYSDTNLICTLDATASTNTGKVGGSAPYTLNDGAYSLILVNDGALDANTSNANYRETIINSLATFTVAPY